MRQSRRGKAQLVHDLESFLWQFEKGEYTPSAMRTALQQLEEVMEQDSRLVGDLALTGDMEELVRDCRSYALGAGNPEKILRDFNKLKKDLEE